jgi:hypothetical protein
MRSFFIKFIREMKSRWMKLAKNVVLMAETRNVQKILVGNPEGKIILKWILNK